MADLDYVKVTGRLGLTVGDGADPDEYPDTIWCDSGTVRFEPLNTYTKIAGGEPVPWTAGHSVIEATVDADGYLTFNGQPYVWLIDLTSEKVNPRVGEDKATYRVVFNVKAGTTSVKFASVSVRLAADTVDPETGACDLTLLSPLPAAGGTPIVVGPPGPAGPAGPGGSDEDVAEYLLSGTETPPALDAAVAGKVSDPDSDTAAALTAKTAMLGSGGVRPPINKSLITSFQPGHGYTNVSSSAAAVVDDTTHYLMGDQSLKVTTKTNGSPANVQKTGQSIDATAKTFRVLVKVSDMSALTSLIFYASSDSGFTAYYQWSYAADGGDAQQIMKSGEWFWITLSFADALVVGTPDRSSITVLRLRGQARNGNSIDVSWGGVALVDEPDAFPVGVISFAYDDSYSSTYDEARKALDKYGWVGTEYVICDLIDAGSIYMTSAQLDALHQSGWEIASHSLTVADHATAFTGLTDAQLEENLSQMKRWMQERGYLRAWNHLAYPKGAYSIENLAVVGRYYATARTVNKVTTETLRPADPLRLRSLSVNPNDSVASVKARIDAAYENRAWLIITFHDLVASANPSIGTQYDIAKHAEIVEYVASKDMPVLPVGEVAATLA